MESEDLPPPKPKAYAPLVLDGWSATDLRAYLAHLEAEAGRVKACLDAKTSLHAAAESLFRR